MRYFKNIQTGFGEVSPSMNQLNFIHKKLLFKMLGNEVEKKHYRVDTSSRKTVGKHKTQVKILINK